MTLASLAVVQTWRLGGQPLKWQAAARSRGSPQQLRWKRRRRVASMQMHTVFYLCISRRQRPGAWHYRVLRQQPQHEMPYQGRHQLWDCQVSSTCRCRRLQAAALARRGSQNMALLFLRLLRVCQPVSCRRPWRHRCCQWKRTTTISSDRLMEAQTPATLAAIRAACGGGKLWEP